MCSYAPNTHLVEICRLAQVEDNEIIKFDMSKINAVDEDIESTYDKQALEA